MHSVKALTSKAVLGWLHIVLQYSNSYDLKNGPRQRASLIEYMQQAVASPGQRSGIPITSEEGFLTVAKVGTL